MDNYYVVLCQLDFFPDTRTLNEVIYRTPILIGTMDEKGLAIFKENVVEKFCLDKVCREKQRRRILEESEGSEDAVEHSLEGCLFSCHSKVVILRAETEQPEPTLSERSYLSGNIYIVWIRREQDLDHNDWIKIQMGEDTEKEGYVIASEYIAKVANAVKKVTMGECHENVDDNSSDSSIHIDATDSDIPDLNTTIDEQPLDLEQFRKSLPPVPRGRESNTNWIHVEEFVRYPDVNRQVQSLANDRLESRGGRKTEDGLFGIDRNGYVWAISKQGMPTFYLNRSLSDK